ncbi:MAG TPA: TonB family protein [Burkholderiaceae bacterium]
MNYALSQRGAGRHPVGLSVVIGLHAVLALVLVGSRIAAPTHAADPQVTVLPEPPKVVKVEPTRTPEPDRRLTAPQLVVPVIPDDDRQAPPLQVTPLGPDKPTGPVEVARVDDPPAAKVVRVQPHPASINAGAAQCRPEYPAAAARAGTTGVSRIRFTVDAGGKVSAAQILASSGPTREHRMLDKAAAEALAQCPIVVGTDDMGRPVGTTVDVDYVWTLN